MTLSLSILHNFNPNDAKASSTVGWRSKFRVRKSHARLLFFKIFATSTVRD